MGSQIFGNLIAAFVLGNFPQIAYVLLMLIICAVSVALLFFLKDPQVHHHTAHQETMDEVRSPKSGGPITAVPHHEAHGNLKEGVHKLWVLCKDTRFLWLLPQTLWTGVSIACFSGNLVEMLQNTI